MSREKIEEMAVDLCLIDRCKRLPQEECNNTTCAHCEAEALYNAGYRKQGEWISVEERLPQTDEKYLVYTSGGRIYTSYYYITNTYGFELRDVTHWMPLPEAPKGGAE